MEGSAQILHPALDRSSKGLKPDDNKEEEEENENNDDDIEGKFHCAT
jgi:hypothetical protein